MIEVQVCPLIVMEGPDGVGKSEILRRVKVLLEYTRQHQERMVKTIVHATAEPDFELATGEFLRSYLYGRVKNPSHHTVVQAFLTNRLDHNDRFFKPTMEHAMQIDGYKVGDTFLNNPPLILQSAILCDRYYLSNMVYQSGKDYTQERIWGMNQNPGILKPDLQILLMATTQTLQQRLRLKLGASPSIMDKYDGDKISKIREAYLEGNQFLFSHGERIIMIETDAVEPMNVAQQVVDLILKHTGIY